MTLLAAFIACAAVILWTGARLSRYGDVIAVRTGLGGAWIGLVLLATVTSLPELVTGMSAVMLFDLPDIAAGDAIGSCMFNLLILALLDVQDPKPLTARIHQGHVLAAGFGVAQLGLLGLALAAGERAPHVGWIGLQSLVSLAVYALAARTIFIYERGRRAEVAEERAVEHASLITLRAAVWRYAANAVGLAAAAILLPELAARLSDASGLGRTFVGTLLVAATTSLPEVVVSIASMRIGALDMAAANLFGSNLFNVAVVGLDDLAFRRGPLLEHVSGEHQLSVMAALIMTGIAIVGLTFRASRKRYRLSWDTFAIVGVYVVTIALMARST
ncbi:MAG: sodium:calcium antiporter [Vicinamibacterales bacterium]